MQQDSLKACIVIQTRQNMDTTLALATISITTILPRVYLLTCGNAKLNSFDASCKRRHTGKYYYDVDYCQKIY